MEGEHERRIWKENMDGEHGWGLLVNFIDISTMTVLLLIALLAVWWHNLFLNGKQVKNPPNKHQGRLIPGIGLITVVGRCLDFWPFLICFAIDLKVQTAWFFLLTVALQLLIKRAITGITVIQFVERLRWIQLVTWVWLVAFTLIFSPLLNVVLEAIIAIMEWLNPLVSFTPGWGLSFLSLWLKPELYPELNPELYPGGLIPISLTPASNGKGELLQGAFEAFDLLTTTLVLLKLWTIGKTWALILHIWRVN